MVGLRAGGRSADRYDSYTTTKLFVLVFSSAFKKEISNFGENSPASEREKNVIFIGQPNVLHHQSISAPVERSKLLLLLL